MPKRGTTTAKPKKVGQLPVIRKARTTQRPIRKLRVGERPSPEDLEPSPSPPSSPKKQRASRRNPTKRQVSPVEKAVSKQGIVGRLIQSGSPQKTQSVTRRTRTTASAEGEDVVEGIHNELTRNALPGDDDNVGGMGAAEMPIDPMLEELVPRLHRDIGNDESAGMNANLDGLFDEILDGVKTSEIPILNSHITDSPGPKDDVDGERSTLRFIFFLLTITRV